MVLEMISWVKFNFIELRKKNKKKLKFKISIIYNVTKKKNTKLYNIIKYYYQKLIVNNY